MKEKKMSKQRSFLKKVASSMLAVTVLTTTFIGFDGMRNEVKAAAWRDDSANAVDKLDENKYPGYKEKLKQLQNTYGWTFTILYTGLEWDKAIEGEYLPHGNNLTQKTGEYVCPICGLDTIYEGRDWRCASKYGIAHYMDPRGFIDTDSIFQFETLSYNSKIHNQAGVEKILEGTIMHDKRICDEYSGSYTTKTYSQVIMEAAEQSGASPYYLASRIRLETSGGTSGSVKNTNGYYNFYNIGAGSGSGTIERALAYAKSKGWDSPEASIIGGAKWIANGYINKGQDTTYLQKFNVTDNNTYRHQYQTNIQAANNESWTTSKAYKSMGIFNTPLNFVIPVFEHMPGSSYDPVENEIVTEDVKIQANGNLQIRVAPGTGSEVIGGYPTGTPLLRVEKGVAEMSGYVWDKIVITEGDKKGTYGYVATNYLVPDNSKSYGDETMKANCNLVMRNGPGTTYSTVVEKVNTGTEVTRLKAGEFEVDGRVWDRVEYNGKMGFISTDLLDKVSGTASPTGQIKIDGKTIYASPEANVAKILQEIPGAMIKDKNGNQLEDKKLVPTGATVNGTYTVIKVGDVNGDGKVNTGDTLAMSQHIEDYKKITNNNYLKAADANRDGKVNTGDSLVLRQHVEDFKKLTF